MRNKIHSFRIKIVQLLFAIVCAISYHNHVEFIEKKTIRGWLAVHQAAICRELTKNLPLPQKTVKLKLKQLIEALDQPLILHM
jgi:hypothetical protein